MLKNHYKELSDYEHAEILEYPQVYYIGNGIDGAEREKRKAAEAERKAKAEQQQAQLQMGITEYGYYKAFGTLEVIYSPTSSSEPVEEGGSTRAESSDACAELVILSLCPDGSTAPSVLSASSPESVSICMFTPIYHLMRSPSVIEP